MARLTGLLGVLLTSCGSSDEPEALPDLPPSVAKAAEALRGELRPLRTLALAVTGEVRGEIEPCGCPTLPYGGFERRQRLLEQLRSEGPVITLDAGELLLKGLSTVTRAKDGRADLMLSLSAAVGVDVWTPGPTDLLALGVEGVRGLAGRSPPAISATWTDADGKALLPPSVVIERDGLRVGVIGLSAAPSDRRGREQVRSRDPLLAAQEALAGLPADLDLVVALGNISDAEADRVALGLHGVAALLTTRGAEYDEPRQGAPVPVIEVPDRGRYVGVVRLRLGSTADQPLLLKPDSQAWRDLAGLSAHPDSPRRASLEQSFASLGEGRNLAASWAVPLSGDLDGEAAVSAMLQGWKEESLAKAVSAAAATPTAEEPGYAAAGECVSCHVAEFARWSFTPHARAWEALSTRRATADPECVACHSTGYGEPGGLGELTDANVRKLKGVQCESCHGPLRGHPDDASIKPTPVSEASCLVCHDHANSPSFDFASYLPRATCQGGAPSTTPPATQQENPTSTPPK